MKRYNQSYRSEKYQHVRKKQRTEKFLCRSKDFRDSSLENLGIEFSTRFKMDIRDNPALVCRVIVLKMERACRAIEAFYLPIRTSP